MPDRSSVNHLQWAPAPALPVAASGAIACLVLCAIVLIGWILDVPLFKSALPGGLPMRPWAAVMFALFSSSALLQACRSRDRDLPRWLDALATACAFGGGAIAAISLVEHLTAAAPSSFDLWLFRKQILRDGVVFRGPMAQGATVAGALYAGALLLSASRTPRLRWSAPILVLIAAGIGMLGIAGFIYDARSIYSTFGYASVSMPTACLIVILSIATLSLQPDSFAVAPFLSRHGGGTLARRLMPATLLLPFGVGWILLQGERAGWYGTLVGLTLFACANAISFTMLTWFVARQLNQKDAAREAADHASRRILSESEDRYRTLAESLPQLIWTCRPDGWCDYLSPQWVTYSGIPAEQQLGMRWSEQLHPDDFGAAGAQWSWSVKSAEPFDIEFRIRRHDGVYRWFRTQAVPVRDASGKVHKWLGSNTDIDDRKRAEADLQELTFALERRVEERTAELRAAKEQAESADRLKTDFIMTMSHELRTPLNSIIGFTGTLLTKVPGPLAPEQEKQLSIVRASGRHLLMLIGDMLDVAKIETGAFEVTPEAIDGAQLIRAIAAELEPVAREKHLTIETVADVDTLWLTTDLRGIRQILINLIGNAIKFTERGSITLTISSAVVRGHRLVELAVSDSGIGIDPKDFAKLFRKFSRLHDANHSTAGGTGLGLYLCRLIADRLGASITVDSVLDRGSTFRVIFDEANAPTNTSS